MVILRNRDRWRLSADPRLTLPSLFQTSTLNYAMEYYSYLVFVLYAIKQCWYGDFYVNLMLICNIKCMVDLQILQSPMLVINPLLSKSIQKTWIPEEEAIIAQHSAFVLVPDILSGSHDYCVNNINCSFRRYSHSNFNSFISNFNNI